MKSSVVTHRPQFVDGSQLIDGELSAGASASSAADAASPSASTSALVERKESKEELKQFSLLRLKSSSPTLGSFEGFWRALSPLEEIKFLINGNLGSESEYSKYQGISIDTTIGWACKFIEHFKLNSTYLIRSDGKRDVKIKKVEQLLLQLRKLYGLAREIRAINPKLPNFVT